MLSYPVSRQNRLKFFKTRPSLCKSNIYFYSNLNILQCIYAPAGKSASYVTFKNAIHLQGSLNISLEVTFGGGVGFGCTIVKQFVSYCLTSTNCCHPFVIQVPQLSFNLFHCLVSYFNRGAWIIAGLLCVGEVVVASPRDHREEYPPQLNNCRQIERGGRFDSVGGNLLCEINHIGDGRVASFKACSSQGCSSC